MGVGAGVPGLARHREVVIAEAGAPGVLVTLRDTYAGNMYA